MLLSEHLILILHYGIIFALAYTSLIQVYLEGEFEFLLRLLDLAHVLSDLVLNLLQLLLSLLLGGCQLRC